MRALRVSPGLRRLRKFVFYGLAPNGAVLAREELREPDVEAARRAALCRLPNYPRIELWEDTVCVLRDRRRQG